MKTKEKEKTMTSPMTLREKYQEFIQLRNQIISEVCPYRSGDIIMVASDTGRKMRPTRITDVDLEVTYIEFRPLFTVYGLMDFGKGDFVREHTVEVSWSYQTDDALEEAQEKLYNEEAMLALID